MPNYNHCTFIGHLTRDVELRNAGSSPVASFCIAVNHNYKTASGEKREEVTFLDCEAWGKTAEIIAQYFAKGSAILAAGRMKQDSWDDKSGQKHTKLKLVVEKFTFVGGKGKGKDDGESAPAKGAGKWPSRSQSVPISSIEDDDLPF